MLHKSVYRLRRKAAACAVCAALLLTPALAASFTDVPQNAWYAAAVNEVVDAGLLSGTSATTFQPGGKVTRAMTVTALWRLAGSPAPKSSQSFSDVPSDAWYSQAVAWAAETGVASGNGKGAFQPGNLVTREQLAVFLYQYAQSQGLDTAQGKLSAYTDGNTVSKWAVDGMEHAVGAGLISGSKGKLSPKANATRAELAVVLERLMTPAVG